MQHEGFPPPPSALDMTTVDSSPRPGSPTGLIYGAGRAASRIWAWQPTHCWPVCLLSVIFRIFTITHRTSVCVCMRSCTLLVFSPEALLLLLHSLNIKPEKKYSTFVSDIYSASIEKTETVEAQRHEQISQSRKGHGERALFLNERWPLEHEPLQSVTKKLICHVSSSSASSSWGWDHNVEKSWLASFLSFVLSFSCKISFLEHNKGFL